MIHSQGVLYLEYQLANELIRSEECSSDVHQRLHDYLMYGVAVPKPASECLDYASQVE